MNFKHKLAIGFFVFLGFITAETGLSPIVDNVSAKTHTTQCDYGPDTCLPGYVWREAYPGDRTCVVGSTRAQAAADNAQAAARRDPQGAYGPDTCIQGYVWREANQSDRVCVLPSVREQTAQDNRMAASRRAPNCAPIWGWADLHTHPFAYEGFGGGGSVLYGKAYGPRNTALAQCDSVHGLGGVNDLVGMVMHRFYTNQLQWGHGTDGNPGFAGWPRWDDVTHQAMHEESLKRAVDGGLRLMVAHAVNNEWMCATAKGVDMTAANVAAAAAFATGGPSAAVATLTNIISAQAAISQADFLVGNIPAVCKDMPSVDRQISEAYAMQSSIDARSGGPGLGWFRIVKDPVEAMSVMRQGKLAVILGIEVDNLFGCYVSGSCTETTVRQQLDRYFAMGVRHVFPIHFYDNAFGGSSNSNLLTSKQWKAPLAKETCRDYAYIYDGNQCNSKGLTRLGEFLIRELALRGMIIDTDHMSAQTFKDALNMLEPLSYPAVSGHVGFNELNRGDKSHEGNRTPAEVQRIQRVNGMVATITHQGNLNEINTEPGTRAIFHTCGNSSETTAQAYMYAVNHLPGQPVGIGTDFNGFAGQPGPRFGTQACPGGKGPGYQAKPQLAYPFTIRTSHGSVTMNRGLVGQRTYDFNTDGLAHIGLVPDMIADWQNMGLDAKDLDPLFDSAAGYMRLWMRARDSSKRVSGTRAMAITVSPEAIIADTPQTIIVNARDIYHGDLLTSGEVWINGVKMGNIGQAFSRTVASYAVPKKCIWVRDDPRSRPRQECEPAHRNADPLTIEVRATNYSNSRFTIAVSLP